MCVLNFAIFFEKFTKLSTVELCHYRKIAKLNTCEKFLKCKNRKIWHTVPLSVLLPEYGFRKEIKQQKWLSISLFSLFLVNNYTIFFFVTFIHTRLCTVTSVEKWSDISTLWYIIWFPLWNFFGWWGWDVLGII